MTEYLGKINEVGSESIAYVDETGIDEYMYRERAWSRKGTRVRDRISGRKYKRTGLAAALCRGRITDPMQYNGTMNSELFEAWLRDSLCPALPECSTIVMDNASFHRKAKVEEIVCEFGHKVIFLPPYSPELNPIERYWSSLKKRLRSVMQRMQSLDEAICCCL